MKDHNHPAPKGKRLLFTILLNLGITIMQVAGGIFSGSMALLSDALHNLGDVATLGISYIALKLSGRRYTLQQTFGYKRAEIMAAFINAVTMIVVSILLIYESVQRIVDPRVIDAGWVMILAGIGIIANGISAWILKQDAEGSMNIKSSYIHLLADMLTSVAVLAGGIVMYFWQIYLVDVIISIFISGYLIYMAWALLIQSLKVLMLFTPSSVIIEDIADTVKRISGVKNIHHVHVWQLNEDEIHFEAHVDLLENLRIDQVTGIMDKIRELLVKEFQISHVTLQPECGSCNDTGLIKDH